MARLSVGDRLTVCVCAAGESELEAPVRSWPDTISSSLGLVTFLVGIFFLEFFVPREVGGTDDCNFEFGFTELETAGDIVSREGITSA